MIRYSEIGLKSRKIRKEFENLLIKDIKNACKYLGIDAFIRYIDGRIVIEAEKYIENILKEVGGIHSFSPVIITGASLDEIKNTALKYSHFIKEGESFALRVRKAGHHEFKSRDVAIIVGDAIRKSRNAKVDLTKPQHEIFIEIRDRYTFIFTTVINGIGGLPYGSQGKVLAYVEDMKDIKAGYFMMRRGCHVDFAINKDMEEVIEKIMKWRKYRIFKCSNIKHAEKIAVENGNMAIVTGKENFVKLSIPVFYPLIGEEYMRIKMDYTGNDADAITFSK